MTKAHTIPTTMRKRIKVRAANLIPHLNCEKDVDQDIVELQSELRNLGSSFLERVGHQRTFYLMLQRKFCLLLRIRKAEKRAGEVWKSTLPVPQRFAIRVPRNLFHNLSLPFCHPHTVPQSFECSRSQSFRKNMSRIQKTWKILGRGTPQVMCGGIV